MPMIWAGNGGRLHQGGSREGGKKWSGSGNIPTDRRHERCGRKGGAKDDCEGFYLSKRTEGWSHQRKWPGVQFRECYTSKQALWVDKGGAGRKALTW